MKRWPTAMMLGLAVLLPVQRPAPVAPAGVVAQTGWPVFHFDLARTGNNPLENVLDPSNVGTLVESWAAPTRDAITTSSPAVVGDSVYVGDFGGDLYAFDTASGTERWTVRLGNTPITSPAVARGRIFVGTGLGDTVWALDVATGRKLWKKTFSGSTFSSPAPRGGILYVGTGAGLYALNARTAAVLWWADVGYVSAPPAVVGNVVYVAASDPGGKLLAVKASDGGQLWSTDLSQITVGGPAVAEGLLFVGTQNYIYGDLLAVDALSGEIRWSRQGPVPVTPAVAGGVVYYARGDDRTVRAVDALTGDELWNSTLGGPAYSSPAVANGVLYIGSTDHTVDAIDLSDGSLLWSQPTGNAVGSPAVCNATLYAGSSDRNLYAFRLP